MVTAIVVLLFVAAIVTLSIMRPSRPFSAPGIIDRDRERQLDELRALSDYRPGVGIR